jgi:cytochrome c-type biogenesis protein CcmH
MSLWLILAAMTALALVIVLPPLTRRRDRETARLDHDVAVYRDQLAEIDRDLELGVLSPAEAEAARVEVQRRLLAAADGPAVAGAPTGPLRRIAALVLAVVLPAGALLTYVAFGTPDAPDRLAALRLAPPTADSSAVELAQRIETLIRRAEAEPGDTAAWSELGAALVAAGRPADGAGAYATAIKLGASSATLHAVHGEALLLAAEGAVTPAAKDAFDTALAIDPAEPRARYYLGLGHYQAGRARQALDAWVALEREAPPGAPYLAVLDARITAVAAEAGIDIETLRRNPPPAAGGAETGAAVDVAAMSDDEREAMIASMVDRLADRLRDQPDDLDGWRRLARSYEVLGRTADARDAMSQAAGLAPDDPAVLAEFGRLAYEAAGSPAMVPPQVADIMGRALALDAESPLALWFVGHAAEQDGRAAEARDLWTRLLAQLEPGTPQFDTLKARIDDLDGTQ